MQDWDDSAISRIIQEQRALRDVLNDMLNEVRLGKSRNDAFRCVADRVVCPGTQQFCEYFADGRAFWYKCWADFAGLSHQTRLAKLQKAEATALKAQLKWFSPWFIHFSHHSYHVISSSIESFCYFLKAGF